MNNVDIIGGLTKDIEVKQYNNIAVAKFSLAVNRDFTKEKTSDFIPCVAFGKAAITLGEYGSKGVRLAIQGSIRTGSYTDKNGVKHYTVEVAVNNFEFLSSVKKKSTEPADTDWAYPEAAPEIKLSDW